MKGINSYLVEGAKLLIRARTKPINNVQKVMYGSKPVDGGNFIFTNQEKDLFVSKDPNSAHFIKPLISAREFLNGTNRWCLWLKDISPKELKSMPLVLERVQKVKEFRVKSKKNQLGKLLISQHYLLR